MKPQIPESVTRSLAVSFAGFVLGAGMAQNVLATPTGATVVHGSAQFAAPNANTLEITNSANAIINWQSFNIGQGEITRFIQPSADSAVLNRVTGANVSELLGNLSSNGHVFLINPHGIVVGENAVIDVAGFVASTLNLSDEDFLNGQFNFQGDNAGALIKRGLVTTGPGGELVLIAPQIENHGVLSVDGGALLLAAGEKVTLTRFDLNGIEFEVQAPGNRVLNLGELIARRGAVGVFAGSIDQRGIVEANSLDVDASGNIVLQANDAITVGNGARIAANGNDGGEIRIQSLDGDTMVSGDIVAVGADGIGGYIQVLGERVGLTGQAEVDVSGSNGGGEILVGGDYRGLNPDIQNASGTFVGEDVSLVADATTAGDGGRVIVWADEATRVYGGISAVGGFVEGDGGFVETSAHYLEVTQGPDVSAINGKGGTWLLDPYNIEITTGVTANNSGQPLFTPTDVNSQISSVLINGQLDLGTNVVLDTAGAGVQPGNVTFTAPINKTAGGDATLTVRADGDIFVNNNITSSFGLLNIDFESNRDQGDGLGGIQFGSGFGVNTNNGTARFISRGSLPDGNGVIMNSASGAVNAGSGEIIIQAQIGAIDLTGGTFSALLSDNKVTLEADDFAFTFGAISTSTGTLPEVELRSFSSDVELGTSPNGGLLINNTLLGAINENNLIIESAAGRDVRIEQELMNFTTDTTINSGRDIIFNNGPLSGLFADDINLGLSAARSIVDNSASTVDVDGTTLAFLNLQAAQGIQIETSVSSLQFNNIDSGDVGIIGNSADPLSILGGSNGGDGATTINQTISGIVIDGDVTHASSIASLVISSTGITINNTGSLAGAGGGIRLGPSGSGAITVTNNGTISDSGGVFIDTNGAGSFIHGTTGVINNGGGIGNIEINADDMDLQAGSMIDAGATAKTILNRSTGGNWVLGSLINAALSGAELDTVRNTLSIGSTGSLVSNVLIDDTISFTANQNFAIQTADGVIDFQQAGVGIANANQVFLTANNISNGTAGIDVAANGLTIDTIAGVSLDTAISELVATNTTSGGISIGNSGGDLTIIPSGIQNLGTALGDTISIVNNGGSITVDGLVSAAGGDVVLDALGATSSLEINTDVFSTNGAITLNAGQDVVVNGMSIGGPGTAISALNGQITVNAGRNFSMLGGTLTDEFVLLESGGINATVGGDLLMQGGGADFTDVSLESSGLATLSVIGNAILSGGTGQDAGADIVAGSGLSLSVGGNTSITGGGGQNARVFIGSCDACGAISVSLNMGGDLAIAGGTGSGSAGGIGSGNAAISVTGTIGGDLTLTGGSGGGTMGGEPGAWAIIGTAGIGNDANISLSVDGSVIMSGNNATGDLAMIGTADAGGTIDIDTGLAASGGNMSIGNGFIQTTGVTTLTATGGTGFDGDIILGDGGAIDVGALNTAATDQIDLQTGSRILIGSAATSTLSGALAGLGTLETAGADLTLSDGGTVGEFTMSGGFLRGPGDLVVIGATTVNGGAIAADSTLMASNGVAITGATTLDGVLNNSGMGGWTGAANVTGTGTFNNLSGATFVINNNQGFSPSFVNAGTVNKTSAGMTQFGAYTQTGGVSTFSGTVAIDTLAMSGGIMDGPGNVGVVTALNWTGGTMGDTGTTTSDGSLLIDGAVTLNRTLNNNGSGVWQGANNIGGTGTFNNLATATFDITNNQSINALFNNAGTVTKTGTGTTQFAGYNQTGGTSTLAGTVSADTLDLSGGLLDGDANIDVAMTFNWTGGAMAGTGTTTSNGSLLIDGAVTLDRTLNNAGPGIWQGANDIGGSGMFNNAAGGVFRIDNDQFMGPAFNNASVVNKASAGTTSFVAYQQTGGATRLSGGTLELTDGELLLDGGVLTGTGTVRALSLNHSGGWIVPGNHTGVSNVSTSTDYSAQYGALAIDGDLQMGGAAGIILDLGLSNERGGTAGTDFDLLDITGHAQLNGMLVLVVDQNRFNSTVGETFRPVIRYSSQSGTFSEGNAIPPGYAFSPTVLTQGLGLNVTAVPRRGTGLIPDDELERLRDEFRENILRLKLERERRRKEDEEEEKRRRALMCS